MAIDKKIIAERKAMYGDNFSDIANAWSNKMSIEEHGRTGSLYFTPRSVAMYMATMKQCRIDAIDKKLALFPPPDIGIKLHRSREDSVTDLDNYAWIADNFEEYKAL